MASRSDPTTLVTGASGFLGRHFLEHGASQHDRRSRVLALVRDPDAWKSESWTAGLTHVEPLQGSLDAGDAWMRDPRMTSVRSIVHLAARVEHSRDDPTAAVQTNVVGTSALVALAERLGARMLFVSTSGTVACFASPEEVADESAPDCETRIRHWPYYASKLAAERQARRLADASGTVLTIVRPPVLLGPRDHRLRSSAHVLRVMEGRLPFRLPGGMAFVDVRDVARALHRILALRAPRPLYHLPGYNWTLDAFFEAVAELAGVDLPATRLPPAALRVLARLPSSVRAKLRLPDPVILEMATSFWNVASLYAETELAHRPRPARETLADTIEWLRANHAGEHHAR